MRSKGNWLIRERKRKEMEKNTQQLERARGRIEEVKRAIPSWSRDKKEEKLYSALISKIENLLWECERKKCPI